MTDEHPSDEHTPCEDSDAVVVSWHPAGRAPRRLVFVPRASDGPDYERVEQTFGSGDTWRTVGRELVDDVTVAGDDHRLAGAEPATQSTAPPWGDGDA